MACQLSLSRSCRFIRSSCGCCVFSQQMLMLLLFWLIPFDLEKRRIPFSMVLVGFNWMPRERLCWWWQWCTMRTASITVRLNGHRQGWRKERVKVVCLFVWCKSTQKSDDQSSRQTLHDFSDHWASTTGTHRTLQHDFHYQWPLSSSTKPTLCEFVWVHRCVLFAVLYVLFSLLHWPLTILQLAQLLLPTFFPPSLNHFFIIYSILAESVGTTEFETFIS